MAGEYPVLGAEEIWRRYDALESRLTAPVSERMVALAGLRPGRRVLDLATGRGEPALRAAHRVGPAGHVVAVEPSAGVLQMARDKAAQEGLTNLDFLVADAESVEGLPEAHFHAATCRWGLMYMKAPLAALATARSALLPTGVFVAALWAEPERVPYYTLPRSFLPGYRGLSAADFEAPGPFRYGTLEAIARDFHQAGFTLEDVEETEVSVVEAETSEEVIDWCLALGLATLLNALSASDRQTWKRDCTRALEERRSGGLLRLGGVTRIVRARVADGWSGAASRP